ncbi:MAG: metallopeptidase family protein [Propionibacteriaceae bacterium]|nr:metallopeptidase family protein [Propionibacteriaceae bacterium]
MSRSRDRHDRGLRGPLALPDHKGRALVPLRTPSRAEYFNQCVKDALTTIAEVNPQALVGIVVGVEEVPLLKTAWSGDRVPMSAALEPSKGRPAQIVIYERPLEHRATSRQSLRELVHRTIVEQLSALLGLPIRDLVGDNPPDWED